MAVNAAGGPFLPGPFPFGVFSWDNPMPSYRWKEGGGIMQQQTIPQNRRAARRGKPFRGGRPQSGGRDGTESQHHRVRSRIFMHNMPYCCQVIYFIIYMR